MKYRETGFYIDKVEACMSNIHSELGKELRKHPEDEFYAIDHDLYEVLEFLEEISSGNSNYDLW